MPVKKVGSRWYVYSYKTGKRLKGSYTTKAAAERRAKTSKKYRKDIARVRRRRSRY